MNKFKLILIPLILLALFFTTSKIASQSKPKSKFYDFGEQVIDGEIKSSPHFTQTVKKVNLIDY